MRMQIEPADSLTTLETRLAWNSSFNIQFKLGDDMSRKNAWDKKQAHEAYAKQRDDARIINVLENACCATRCRWSGCEAVLGSWELLRKHMEKIHCDELSPASLGQASSSRPYRCRYVACKNRVFQCGPLLLEHVVSLHLEPLKLRCPLGCKRTPTGFQSLEQHLSSAHKTSLSALPCAPIQHASRLESLPELPGIVPTHIMRSPRVKPSPFFKPPKPSTSAKKKGKSSNNEWSDFAQIDKPNSSSKPFSRLRWPQSGVERPRVRRIPEEYCETDDQGPQDPEVLEDEASDSDEGASEEGESELTEEEESELTEESEEDQLSEESV